MSTRIDFRSAPLRNLVAVRSLDELDWFVKESEMLTGTRGRAFIVAGADRPAFQVHIDHLGYEILRIDLCADAAVPLRATGPDLHHHTLGSALACGMLYTAPIH